MEKDLVKLKATKQKNEVPVNSRENKTVQDRKSNCCLLPLYSAVINISTVITTEVLNINPSKIRI